MSFDPQDPKAQEIQSQNLERQTPERSAAPLESEIEHESGTTPPDVVLEKESDEAHHDPYAALKVPEFRRYLTGGILANAASHMTSVAAGWEIYERVKQPYALGLLGLTAALPVIVLALPAGTLADRLPRKRIVLVADVLASVTLMLLAALSLGWARYARVNTPGVGDSIYIALFYLLILANSVCNAFLGPAVGALVTNLVPKALLPSALKWSSVRWQTAALVGPVVAGFALGYANMGAPIYLLDGLARLVFCAFIWNIRPRPQTPSTETLNWQSVAAGWHFVKKQPLILSTITLDMVAVLFGGATALLPVYASDILHVGSTGLGPLRAAPAVGAVLMGLFLTHRPPFKHAGKTLLWAVGGFGAATVVFGLSRNYALSLLALATLGALDNISVVVRSTLIQLLTPDNMRGRVGAVNSVFIGTSNEIGELESGLAAQALGAIPAVALGGMMTVVIVLAVTYGWPQVRRLGRLEDVKVASTA